MTIFSIQAGHIAAKANPHKGKAVFMKAIIFTVCIGILMMGCYRPIVRPVHPPKGKVAICHKGKKTIYVNNSAAKAHLNHGDYLGPCH